MADVNSVNLTGRLGRDPELRQTAGGDSVANLSVAVETRKDTLWVDVAVWGRTAENACQFLSKGSRVGITGRLTEVRAFTKRDGEPGAALTITANEVAFLSSKSENGGGQASTPAATPAAQPAANTTGHGSDDDIPF